jgi:hypothetical protein
MTNQGMQRAEGGGFPVLPGAWAPLSDEEQKAVLDACERCDAGLLMRLAAPEEPLEEYRVYRLTGDWPNLVVVSRATLVKPAGYGAPIVRNTEFLGVANTAEEGIRLAIAVYRLELR